MDELKDLKVNPDEYDVYNILSDAGKLEYLIDALEIGSEAAILRQIEKSMHLKSDNMESVDTVNDLQVGPYRLCITAYDGTVTFNSDSIKVIRGVVRKLFQDGNILVRDNSIKKDRDYDIYKYFKAYTVMKTGMPICEN